MSSSCPTSALASHCPSAVPAPVAPAPLLCFLGAPASAHAVPSAWKALLHGPPGRLLHIPTPSAFTSFPQGIEGPFQVPGFRGSGSLCSVLMAWIPLSPPGLRFSGNDFCLLPTSYQTADVMRRGPSPPPPVQDLAWGLVAIDSG